MDNLVRDRSKCELAIETLRTSGKLRLQATGSSMLPTLWPGDVLTIEASNCDQVESGDIVLLTRGGRLFIHRVREKLSGPRGRTLITRGDSVPLNDPAVGDRELLGKVSEIFRHDVGFPPANLSASAMVLARLLAYSDFSRRVALRLYERRTGPRLSSKFVSL